MEKRHTQQEGENVPRGTLRQIIRENLSIHGTRALRVRELEAGCLSDPNLWVVFHVEHYVQFSPALLQTSAVFRVERCVSLTHLLLKCGWKYFSKLFGLRRSAYPCTLH